MRGLVIGAGRMGMFHRRALRDLGLDVTTVDPDVAKGADHLRVPHGRFEVVCVATPIKHLAEQAAAWAGHEGWLLVEKPAATSMQDLMGLSVSLEGQYVAVGYVERFNPQVRRLREGLQGAPEPSCAVFRRWNDRPSPDVALDLTSHDADLARFLGLWCPVTFDSRDAQPHRVHTVTIDDDCIDLMAHDTSPLHAQWHAFLSGRPGAATLRDAGYVLEDLEALHSARLITVEEERCRSRLHVQP